MGYCRQSKKRNAIYNTLCSVKNHPTAERIYEQLKSDMPDLSLGTVYRNLSLFKQEGLAVGVAMVNGRERFDACTEPHAHFICRICGNVIDLEGIPIPEFPGLDMKIETSQVNFYGICSGCSEGRQS